MAKKTSTARTGADPQTEAATSPVDEAREQLRAAGAPDQSALAATKDEKSGKKKSGKKTETPKADKKSGKKKSDKKSDKTKSRTKKSGEKKSATLSDEKRAGTKKAGRDGAGSTTPEPQQAPGTGSTGQQGGPVFGDEDFTFSETLRADRGFVLADVDPRSTPGYAGDKKSAALDLAEGQSELSDLQERLWANGRDGDGPAVLLIVQGMDTSGKGGIMRHVVGATDPGGVKYTAFKAPTAEERAHDFLWRIERALPDPGQLGVFDRSQYEDVLVVRVHDLVPRAEWMKRYAQINAFERRCLARGITVVKVMLDISKDEQRERLAERLDRPDKHYKYNPGDIDERARWEDYMEAYQAVLSKTSTRGAPWYVVPADRKWYARLAVQQILLEHLRGLDLQWPEGDFDVEVEQERLARS